jgi:hypothetical protein
MWIEGLKTGVNETEHKREDITGDWRQLLNEKLHHLYSSLSIIKVIKMEEYKTGIACRTYEIDTIQGLTQGKVMLSCA